MVSCDCMRKALAIVPLLLLAACAPSVPPPEKTIESLYAPYLSHAAEDGISTWEKAAVYSKRFKAIIDRGFNYSALLNEPVIDFDPVADAQDYSISNLKIAVDRPPDSGKAHVVARFDNQGRPTEVGYDMVLEDGAWKVDGIRDGDQDFSKTIDEALKTIGDPKAMQAPIEKIYTRYSSKDKIEPIYRWAALTNELRGRLEKAQFNSAFADFDPACGGKSGETTGVTLEAASGGVIARFRVGNEDRVVTYDLVEADGTWLIDDIHGPGNPGWDLTQKLDDAGIH
jgi:hypothetical protein